VNPEREASIEAGFSFFTNKKVVETYILKHFNVLLYSCPFLSLFSLKYRRTFAAI
jgi:hypothetical protein